MLKRIFVVCSLLAPTWHSLAQTAAPADEWMWTPLPAGSRVVILATGADLGFIRPRGCHRGAGGALYRAALNDWFEDHAPDVHRLWVSTGNAGQVGGPQPNSVDLGEMLDLFGRVGYAVAGIGAWDLKEEGVSALQRLARGAVFPLVASNLVIHETGRPALANAVIVDTPVGKIGFAGLVPHAPDRIWGDLKTGAAVTLPPAAVFSDLVSRLRREADLAVLLSTIHQTDLDALLRQTPGWSLVLAQEAAVAKPAAEMVGGTPVLWLGLDGLALGRIALDARGRVLEIRNIAVDESFPVDPATGIRRAAVQSRRSRQSQAPPSGQAW